MYIQLSPATFFTLFVVVSHPSADRRTMFVSRTIMSLQIEPTGE